ncbi:MAG: peptidase MA family metallohydrolase [Candidatus Aminicenantales bacterium]
MFPRFRIKAYAPMALVLLGIGLVFSMAEAQYFGRNKVQYETFDFKVLKTEHFDVYFYPEMEEAAKVAARMAERWYARLSRILDHELRGRQPLILYASAAHFQQTTAIPGMIGEGTGGVTEAFKRRIILPMAGSLEATDHVIGHELVHAFQYDISSQGQPTYAGGGPGIARVPLWFVEGLAEYLSIGAVDAHTAMWMRDATHRKKLPTVKKLESSQYFPYRYGESLWAYITGKYGDRAVASLLKAIGRAGSLEVAIKKVLGVTPEQLSKEWHESLKKVYEPLAEHTELIPPSSRALFKGTEKNRLNVSPSLSPDGKSIVFLSSRDLFSIDMYLADARTGKILRKLVKTAVNPHYESLQFIKSSGSWSPDSKYFVFGGITKGEPVLAIVDVSSGRTEKEFVFKNLGEILNPSWSPDGRYIAFAALEGGFTDLFLFDLQRKELKRLTDDAFTDLYPAWSPEGRRLAFVSDRFSSDLSILAVGDLQLALLDVETGEIRKVPGFIGFKNINPQWSPDGKSLFFISDRTGISNIYRVEIETGHIYQITNLYTGVSGIVSSSPALSVAQETGELAYCVYDQEKYSIYAIDAKEALIGKEPQPSLAKVRPDILPPRTGNQGEVLALINNPLFGLPGRSDFESSDYKPKLALDYVSPAQFAIGADRFGTYAGGGISLVFSDMLGYHTLFTMAQVSSRVEDSAVLVGYQNARRRLNWGAVVQRIPYVFGGFSVGVGDYFGQPALLEQEYIFRQVNYQASTFAYYPFNQVRRFELSAGVRMIDYQQEVRTRVFSLSGFFVDELVQELPAPDSLYFAYGTAALVYDSSFFGATSPILGQSYRLEVTPYFGSISYVTFLADYRRYLMPVRPFTLAFRVLHYGRYGKNSDDSRFYPLFLGYETLVRGYNTSSFSVNEMDVYNQLFGSKLLVANFELRFPLFGVLGIGKGYYGVLPMDFVAFYDTGIAWGLEGENKSLKPFFLGGDRDLLSSAGVGLRLNLFGYLIFGVNMVKPFDRPEKGMYFQFTITPGF